MPMKSLTCQKLLFLGVLILSVFQFVAENKVFSAQQPATTGAQVAISVSTTDSNGTPKSAFSRGEIVLVMIKVNNLA